MGLAGERPPMMLEGVHALKRCSAHLCISNKGKFTCDINGASGNHTELSRVDLQVAVVAERFGLESEFIN